VKKFENRKCIKKERRKRKRGNKKFKIAENRIYQKFFVDHYVWQLVIG
jgi:hypothetical protein